ncbi:DUF6716 putative glycosyltransferase [Homoserinibacter sp. GY 40078]|uniref:DUF6716 putative glycosyltransferase n=1 Tax=Homoserinibacter sp. GY 40078 TaxID=2603275 RepID=UPI0011C8F10C|nr:DUF6716 putative glycosyltransferase [Homoserinibacter sp. GY 40078]TXK17127.1 hypothetical protein FVQ89_09660 [Homoserinibacter sp. GY 40078]
MRVVAIADSDSYVKWAAATLAALPDDVERSLVIVDTRAAPSATQRSAALHGSGIGSDDVTLATLPELRRVIAPRGADVVLVATRGPQARVLLRELAKLDPRPVLVSGMPGISVPATRKALIFRHQADLFVVHSRREVREFRVLARELGADRAIAMAALPFARESVAQQAEGEDLVFAVQSVVPAELDDRRAVARMLIAAAEDDPGRRVVVKVRAMGAERQTHDERFPIPDLIAAELEGRRMPQNLVVSGEPMSTALERAHGLVTVSSTAVLEAIARRIPVIALDDFGISPVLINEVFRGSGLFGGADDVVARRFRHPDPSWVDDNYFHAPAQDDLVPRLRELVEARRAGELAPRAAQPLWGGALRLRWQRMLAFPDSEPRSVRVALLTVGVPARAGAVLVRRARRAVRAYRGRLIDQTVP